MHRFKTLMLAALMAAAPSAAGASELVTNGGFETGDFSGWAQIGDTDNDFVDGLSARSGEVGGYFGAPSASGGITQILDTIAGETYTINLWLANEGGAPNAATISFGDTILFAAQDDPGFAYRQLSYLATATGVQTALTFNFQHAGANFSLDDISVVQGIVPEPASWALMILGFGMMGTALRRRTAAAATA